MWRFVGQLSVGFVLYRIVGMVFARRVFWFCKRVKHPMFSWRNMMTLFAVLYVAAWLWVLAIYFGVVLLGMRAFLSLFYGCLIQVLYVLGVKWWVYSPFEEFLAWARVIVALWLIILVLW